MGEDTLFHRKFYFAAVAMKHTLKLSVYLELCYWGFQDRKHTAYVTNTYRLLTMSK